MVVIVPYVVHSSFCSLLNGITTSLVQQAIRCLVVWSEVQIAKRIKPHIALVQQENVY